VDVVTSLDSCTQTYAFFATIKTRFVTMVTVKTNRSRNSGLVVGIEAGKKTKSKHIKSKSHLATTYEKTILGKASYC
jgi:hypothetical protein